jgi:hypothetical protein
MITIPKDAVTSDNKRALGNQDLQEIVIIDGKEHYVLKTLLKINDKEYDADIYTEIGGKPILWSEYESIINTCFSYGLYWRSKYETEDYKHELRFIIKLCNAEEKIQIHKELLSDILDGSHKIFSKQTNLGEPIESEIPDGENVYILKYETLEDLYEDLVSAKNHIEELEKELGYKPIIDVK